MKIKEKFVSYFNNTESTRFLTLKYYTQQIGIHFAFNI